jgi:energy-coupling factor transport system permease protein
VKNFEFLHNITIGQYLPVESPVHRLHPATKMFIAVSFMTAVVIAGSLSSLIAALVAVLVGLKCARIPWGYALRGLRPAIPIFILLAILQILFAARSDVGTVFWRFGIIVITAQDFLLAARLVGRLTVLILVISLFSFSTSSKELTHGTEKFFSPLKVIGFPAHELALVLAIAMRFLPLLAMEAERLMKAQVSRGADFGKGRMGLFKRIYRMLPLFAPLFLAALRRAEHLILAMEARCYAGGKGRTHLIHFRLRPSDGLAAGVVSALACLILALHFAGIDAKVWTRLVGAG